MDRLIPKTKVEAAAAETDWREFARLEYSQKRQKLATARQGYLNTAARATAKAEALKEDLRKLDDGASAFGILVEGDAEIAAFQGAVDADGKTPRSGPLFKDIAFDLLKTAYPNPLRAAEIKEKIETRLARKFHSKTPGMSLYRLAQDGLVERKGWDWFFVPENRREKKKPGKELLDEMFITK